MPACKYLVLDGSATGAPVKFATVGQQVYHKWSPIFILDVNRAVHNKIVSACEDADGNNAAAVAGIVERDYIGTLFQLRLIAYT